jgi:hypothetical protein
MHKRRAVKRFLTQHAGVVREPLAPYSPEYNPIDRCWQWRKAKVYAATAFHTIDDVICKVRQLMWHDHAGWLTSTMHFDLTLYREILSDSSPLFKAVLKKRCKVLYRALKKSLKPPKSAVGAASERSHADRSVGASQ